MGVVGRIAPVLAALVAIGMGVPARAAPRPVSTEPAPERGQAPLLIIKRIENPDMQVSITFDACATNNYGYGFDRPVFEVLRREQIPSTIFVSGLWVESHPDEMKELASEPMIEFANHSYDHPHMGRLTISEIEDEIDRTEAALGLHGVRSVAFRPPYGEYTDRVLEVARERQLPAVLWDVVSGDPSAGTTVEAMVRTVVSKTRPGSIVIFHINGRETKTALALPAILRQLRARRFQLVQLSTLLAWRGAAAVAATTTAITDPAPPLGQDAPMPLGSSSSKIRTIVRTLETPDQAVDRLIERLDQPPDAFDRSRPGCDGQNRTSCR
jgi:peptidoglycan/xylan/chitin deacetylase (PgdA/CDA1 family)